MAKYRARTHIGGLPLRHAPAGFVMPGTLIEDEHIKNYGWTDEQIADMIRVGGLEEVDENGNPVVAANMVDLPRVSDNSDLPVTGRDPALQSDPVKPHLTGEENPMELPGVPGVEETPDLEDVNPVAASFAETPEENQETVRGRRSR